MYVNFEIEKQSDLQMEVWQFIVIETKILLNHYEFKVRESKRKKFITEKSYHRISTRDYNGERLEAHDVPLSEELKSEAKQKYFDMLTIGISTGK